tara:strand:- start:287 stop:694 length:408 start_codon:yes stop_codon:yes gene_type:complete
MPRSLFTPRGPARPPPSVVDRKLKFVRNALKRYYDIMHLDIRLNDATAIVSTEIGILHDFIQTVLADELGLPPRARIVDCMAGAGTISLCLALHFPHAELHAIEILPERALLLEHNLAQVLCVRCLRVACRRVSV